MKATKLPDKLSDLLYVALEDLEKVERDPRYRIDMGTWHQPNGKCAVCAAGSVMAMRLGVRVDQPSDVEDFDDDTSRKLRAINYLRMGAVWRAADVIGVQLPETMPEHLEDGVYDYRPASLSEMSHSGRTRQHWKKHMVDLIGILQAEGL